MLDLGAVSASGTLRMERDACNRESESSLGGRRAVGLASSRRAYGTSTLCPTLALLLQTKM